MELGEWSALGCAVMWAIATILFKRAGESVPPFLLNLFKNTLAVILFGITLLVVEGFTWPEISGRDYALISFSAFIGIACADAIFFRSLNLLGAGRSAVVSCMYSPFVVFFSVVLLKEEMSAKQLAGFVLVVSGALLAGFDQGAHHHDKQHLRKGVALGALAMFIMSFAIVLIKPQIEALPLLAVTELRLVVAVVGSLIVLAVQGKTGELRLFLKPLPWKYILSGSVAGAYGAMLLWMGGFKYAKASTASILNQTSVIFVMILAAWFLKERMDRRKIFGAALAFTGVSLIAFNAR